LSGPLESAGLVLLLGVPVPLTIHGFDTHGEGVETHRPIRAEAQILANPLARPVGVPLRLGAGASIATVLGRDDGPVQARLRFTTLTLPVMLGPVGLPCLADPATVGLSVAVGPALAFQHLYVDEGLNLDTYAWGLRSRLSAHVCPLDTRAICLTVDAAWDAHAPAADRARYFNHRLGQSAIASLNAGLTLWVD
jgi:hypothetical protein